jgi:hypothetical protein
VQSNNLAHRVSIVVETWAAASSDIEQHGFEPIDFGGAFPQVCAVGYYLLVAADCTLAQKYQSSTKPRAVCAVIQRLGDNFPALHLNWEGPPPDKNPDFLSFRRAFYNFTTGIFFRILL